MLLRVSIIVGVMSVFPATAIAQAELRVPLAAGMYRLEGKCLELKDSISDMLGQCEDHFGIDATDPKLPNFIVFTRPGKGWMFWSMRAKKISADGKRAEYSLKYFTDVTLGSTYDFDGECILDMGDKIRIECRARRGRKIIRSAIFESQGTFVFSRAGESAGENSPTAQ